MTQEATTNPFAEFDQFFLADEGRVEINTPNQEPMMFNGQQVVIVIHGPSTEEFAKAKAIREKAATTRVFAAMANGRKKQKGATEAKAADEVDAEFLAAITKRIENLPTYPGGFKAFYADLRLQYVARQVEAYAGDLGNFFPS